MHKEIERLTELAAYKTEWQELKWIHESLLKKSQLVEEELIELKKEHKGLASTTSDEAQQLKQEVKYLKEQRLLSDASWEAILADKEEQLKKQARTAQQK